MKSSEGAVAAASGMAAVASDQRDTPARSMRLGGGGKQGGVKAGRREGEGGEK